MKYRIIICWWSEDLCSQHFISTGIIMSLSEQYQFRDFAGKFSSTFIPLFLFELSKRIHLHSNVSTNNMTSIHCRSEFVHRTIDKNKDISYSETFISSLKMCRARKETGKNFEFGMDLWFLLCWFVTEYSIWSMNFACLKPVASLQRLRRNVIIITKLREKKYYLNTQYVFQYECNSFFFGFKG